MNLRSISQISFFALAAGLAAMAGCSDDGDTSSSASSNGGAGGTGGASSSSSSNSSSSSSSSSAGGSGGAGGAGSACGDGMMEGAETCDDGNTTAGDGCDAQCALESGWDCTGMPSTCTSICADGVVVGTEGCDDGNSDNGDGCDDQCAVEAGYECSGEPSACGPLCGDGVIIGHMGGGMGGAGGAGMGGAGGAGMGGAGGAGMGGAGGAGMGGAGGAGMGGAGGAGMGGAGGGGMVGVMEGCDDGNTLDGDGCSAMCEPEMGWQCSGEPSVCSQVETVTDVAIGQNFGNTNLPEFYCHDMTFSSAGTVIGPIELTFALSHTYVGDLSVDITSPNNTVTVLFDEPGPDLFGDSSNLISSSPLTFKAGGQYNADNMGVALLSTDDVICQDDNECEFFPNPGDMAAFNGEAVTGVWTVCFRDSYDSLDEGMLESVSLSIPWQP